MPNKLTDTEVKKALEHCADVNSICETCVLFNPKDDDCKCSRVLKRNALDLINRQDEKIAEKERIIGLAEKAVVSMKKEIEKLVAEKHIAKAEAYKECIEKVKEKSKKTEVVASGALITTSYAISAKNLNNLLNELVGDRSGES